MRQPKAGGSGWVGRRLLKRLVFGVLRFVVRPFRDVVRTIRGTHPVRIFTFHRLSAEHVDGMTIAPDVFQRQLTYVAKHHEVVSLEEALRLLDVGAKLRRPRAVITFDDGYRSVVEVAFRLMRRVGVSGCCFVATDFIGTDRRYAHDDDSVPEQDRRTMDWTDLATLRDAGWSIGSHSASHARLSECGADKTYHELARSQSVLRERLGLQVHTLAYPFGGMDDMTEENRQVARRLGYRAILSNWGGGENLAGEDPSYLRRQDIGGPHPDFAWKAWMHGLTPRWFERVRRRIRGGA